MKIIKNAGGGWQFKKKNAGGERVEMAVPSNSALFEGIGGDFGYSHGK